MMQPATPRHLLPLHGGPDALGVPAWDFSTNSNAAGPCPHTLAALAQADACHYPEPSYSALRNALAALHQVSPQRVLMGASGSELIARLTGWCARHAQHTHAPHTLNTAGSPANLPATPAKVWLPAHAYGDYAHAAQLHGLHTCSNVADADLIWLCAPSSPHGQALTLPQQWHARQRLTTVVLDCAYAPLQLSQTPIAPGLDRHSCWQIWTPNKALGLCGIRAAYAIAPEQADAQAVEQLAAWAPSWPIGSHGVALLHSWCTPEAQAWLVQARATLQRWKQQQLALLHGLGWQCAPSETNFFIACPPAHIPLPDLLAQLRRQGIKLRDAASFGLPGWVRLCVHTPQAQAALAQQIKAHT